MTARRVGDADGATAEPRGATDPRSAAAGSPSSQDSVVARLGLRPLTARSVLLSVLLGTHPPELPVGTLVRAGALFGIPQGTLRVALSRMATEGDVVAKAGRYRLAGRLVQRQRRQDEGRAAETLPWDGRWEIVIADPVVRGAAELADLGVMLSRLRLAEWRSGVWARPANLARGWPAGPQHGVRYVSADPVDDAVGLVGFLWDLAGWAERAVDLIAAMDSEPDPASHIAVSAAAVQHLRDDPLLPSDVLPPAWPGALLRRRYAAFEAELSEMLRSVRSHSAEAGMSP